MWATFWDAFQEVGGRRVVLILFILALLVGLLFNRFIRFERLGNVEVLYQGPVNLGPWAFSVPTALGQVTLLAGMIWSVMMIFAGCPQFVAMLEKGWRELTFSKGTARWQIFLARYVSLTLLFFVLTVATCLPLAVRLWWHTGVPTWGIFGGAVISTFSFAALLVTGAFASTAAEAGVAFPIIVPFATSIASQFLLNRETIIYDYITSEFWRRAVDWLYYVLPKNQELQNAAATYVRSAVLPTSWPLWTTGLFTAAALVCTVWVLERKSF